MNTYTHKGFDLFLSKVTMKKAKVIVSALNQRDCKMNGQSLNFKINKKHSRPLKHQAKSVVITTFYKPVTASAADLILGLENNRDTLEPLAQALDFEYEGSEFYVTANDRKDSESVAVTIMSEVERIVAEYKAENRK